MENKTMHVKSSDHPGVYIPPPFIYVVFFFLSIQIQHVYPLDTSWFEDRVAHGLGWILIALHFVFLLPALWLFLISKNTLIPIKAAHSLQTSGVYSMTRNPMYLGLLFLYVGMAMFKGNWWTLIEIPLVIIVVQLYVIRREEQYLQRAFNDEFDAYRKMVRRWI